MYKLLYIVTKNYLNYLFFLDLAIDNTKISHLGNGRVNTPCMWGMILLKIIMLNNCKLWYVWIQLREIKIYIYIHTFESLFNSKAFLYKGKILIKAYTGQIKLQMMSCMLKLNAILWQQKLNIED